VADRSVCNSMAFGSSRTLAVQLTSLFVLTCFRYDLTVSATAMTSSSSCVEDIPSRAARADIVVDGRVRARHAGSSAVWYKQQSFEATIQPSMLSYFNVTFRARRVLKGWLQKDRETKVLLLPLLLMLVLLLLSLGYFCSCPVLLLGLLMGYRGTAMTLGTSRSSSDRSLIRRTVSTVCQLWSSVLVTSCSSAETDRLPCRRAAEGAGRHSRRRQARCSFSCPASRRLTLAKPHHWLASTAATDVVSNACRQFVTTP